MRNSKFTNDIFVIESDHKTMQIFIVHTCKNRSKIIFYGISEKTLECWNSKWYPGCKYLRQSNFWSENIFATFTPQNHTKFCIGKLFKVKTQQTLFSCFLSKTNAILTKKVPLQTFHCKISKRIQNFISIEHLWTHDSLFICCLNIHKKGCKHDLPAGTYIFQKG